MDSFDSDNVKAEKEDAVWRYNMEKMLRDSLSFIVIFLVLLLLSCSWFPTLIPDTVHVVGNFFRRFISSFNNPLFTFEHEYVSSRRSIHLVPDKEETPMEKQIVLVENAAVISPVKQQQLSSTIVNTITETKRSVSQIKPQQSKEYRRSRLVSESQSQRVPREFGRSDTEPPRKSMEEMSSEEFQLIIDSFIAEKKKCLMLKNTREERKLDVDCC
ncbi:hypothetical protein F3Y22_tig00004004pilonHSYRG00006 [Hibiscus syriacus]|uniref:Transmembrane protein n=1 Tax=Hibiscus syriacus TaxID=106335 RepID=A0A6A3CNT9_HIBSY|nr:hypothetical protein F3Y22_tig00004004pilonHSYRG00006 [Hibiscus syriacus]